MIDARLLQLCDTAFPSGAFSHSFGLETAIAEARVRDAAGVREWLTAYLADSLGTLDARAIVLGIRKTAGAFELDAALAASTFATEVRIANRRLARATLDAYITMGIDDRTVRSYREAISGGRAHGFHAVACMLGYRAIGTKPEDAVCAYVSSAGSALAAVAARAVPLGQRDVGALLWSLRPLITTIAEEAAMTTGIEDFSSSAVACEIDAMRHARLDARLFAS